MAPPRPHPERPRRLHVERLAAETHVAGSDANDRVVAYLGQTLASLGLHTRVQNAVGTYQAEAGTAEMARVRNVVGALPGTDSTGRIVLMAHHDSVQTGPGGSDAGAGVSAILESVRALRAAEPLRNDVLVVLTDAEEACLCGADAFAARHPMAAEGGVVLNLEARGTTGPPIMFETSMGNQRMAAAYAAAAPHPVASSFAVEVYRTLPRDTDFSVMVADGDWTGLTSAYIDGAAAYHTAQDTPARMDRGSLQAQGDNTLALVRELGDRDLGPMAEPAAQEPPTSRCSTGWSGTPVRSCGRWRSPRWLPSRCSSWWLASVGRSPCRGPSAPSSSPCFP